MAARAELENVNAKNLRVNGSLHKDHSITHELIANGAPLAFEMIDKY